MGLHPEHHQRGTLGGSHVTQVCHRRSALFPQKPAPKWDLTLIKSSLTFRFFGFVIIFNVVCENKLGTRLIKPSAAVRGATRWSCFAMWMIYQSHNPNCTISQNGGFQMIRQTKEGEIKQITSADGSFPSC